MARYTYRGWVIGNKGTEFNANKNGFFTGYKTFNTTGAFLDWLEATYPELTAA